MSELGQLLELLYTAHRGVNSMFLEMSDWGPPEEADPLIVASDSIGNVRVQWATRSRPSVTPTSSTRRVWFQQPDRIRVEVVCRGVVVMAAVRHNAAWWRWDQNEGESTGDLTRGTALPHLLELPLLRPCRLLPAMWFEVAGAGSRADRDVLIAAGTPRDGTRDAPHHFVLEFDLEHGTQLRTARFDGDECTAVTEVTSVDYSPTIHPDIFSFAVLGNHRPAPPDARSSVNPASMNQPALTPPRSQVTERPTVWLTGLSGAGKSTIARTTERLLNQLGIPCCVLDGDEVRLGLSADLGLSREDRREQARRVAHVAATLADSGVIPIVALVSPYAEDRERARQIHNVAGVHFVEVWVDTPLEICAARDPKGLYAAARADASTRDARPAADGSRLSGLALCETTQADDGSGLTGLTSPYEAPRNPDLRISSHEHHPRVLAAEILEKIFSNPARAQVFVA